MTRSTIARLPLTPPVMLNCAHAVSTSDFSRLNVRPYRPRLSVTTSNTESSAPIACRACPTAAPNGP